MTITKDRSTSHYQELVRILGRRYIRSKVESPLDFILIAEKGLSANVVDNFRKHFGISMPEAASMLNTSEPTLYRWTRENKRLGSTYSVKLFELSDLFLKGAVVFGSQENFFKWMALPNAALGGMLPEDLLVYPDGVSKVRDLLGRIQHGVYS